VTRRARGLGRRAVVAFQRALGFLFSPDDSTSYASKALTVPANAFTVVAWVNPNAWPSDGSTFGLMGKANTGVSSSFAVRLGSDVIGTDVGDALETWLATTSNEVFGNASCSNGGRYSNPPASLWTQIAIVFDGSGLTNAARLKVYLNTNPLSLTFTGTQPTALVNVGTVFELWTKIASGVRTIGPGGGYSDLCFYDRALSETELGDHLAGTPPSDYFERDTFTRSLNGFTSVGSTEIVRPTTRPTFQRLIRVHFIGDSIMRGQEPDWSGTYRGGLRRYVMNMLSLQGIYVRSVGSYTTQGGYGHENGALNGALVDDMFVECQASAALSPDVVVLIAGTNNARSGQPISPSQTRADFETAIADIRTGQSTVPIVVTNCPPIPSETPIGQEFADGEASFVVNVLGPEQYSNGANLRSVVSAISFAMMSSDGVHELDAGYQEHADTLTPVIADLPVQGSAPAAEQRATLRAAGTCDLLFDNRARPTESGGFISSRLDLHADDAGTGSHTAVAGGAGGTGLVWMGNSDKGRAGQDLNPAGALLLSAGDYLPTGGACTLSCLFRSFSSPVLDLLGGQGYFSVERGAAGNVAYAYSRTIDAGASFKIYFTANTNGGITAMTIPYTPTTSADRLFTFRFLGGDASDPANYQAWLDGVAQTVTLATFGDAGVGYTRGSIAAIYNGGANYFYLDGCVKQLVAMRETSAGVLTAINTYMDAAKTPLH